MRILVTGGAGFIGSNLVHLLLSKKIGELLPNIERVVTLDKMTYAGNRSSLDVADSRLVFVQGDICDSILVAKLLREHRIDAVMHLAAESHVDRSIDSPEEFIMTNVVGTLRLLEEFKQYLMESAPFPPSGASLADGWRHAFLHVSTDEVFGSLGPDDPAFCERTRYSPNSPYSASKAGSDHLARAYHQTYGLPVITTHCSNNYGPYQFPEKLLPLMIRKILKGETLPVYGDGENVRDWLFVEDHCRALVTALARGKFGETYVIGGNCQMKNIDVVKAVIRTVQNLVPSSANHSESDLIRFVEDRPGHDLRYAINPARIENELGWIPNETFESGLLKTVQWYINHQPWIEQIEQRIYRGERLGKIHGQLAV